MHRIDCRSNSNVRSGIGCVATVGGGEHPCVSPRAVCMVLVCMVAIVAPTFGQSTTAHDGADLVFGGPGAEPGKFLELRDITFDSQGNLWTLEGAKYDAKSGERTGNLRVQRFSGDGKPLAVIDLKDDAVGAKLGSKNDPQRLAVTSQGEVYVTLPAAGRVQRFSPEGKLLEALPFEGAMAIAITGAGKGDRERVALVCSREQIMKGKRSWLGGGEIILLQPGGVVDAAGRVKLQIDKPLEKVQDIAVDRAGNFYVQAEPNAVYQFSPQGKLLRTLGGNPTSRNEDGSEVLHTVAVDSKGNVYTYTWGNPGLVTRFSADGQAVTQRGGQFKFADPWSVHSHYTVLAIAPDDRLWVAATHMHDPKNPNIDRYRAVPAIIRTNADFFEKPAGAVKQTPTRLLGFKPELSGDLLYNVANETGQKVTMTYRVAPANRVARSADVTWRVLDAGKHEAAQGKFHLDLVNGVEAKTTFSFEIKAIDPKIQVMGPATVFMDIKWLGRLYELGFKEVSDIVSLHDYEGHESITPEHWRWKLGEVRKIMTAHGDGQKPIWQTERAITGVRGFNFMGLVQAIRTTLHRDLLETLQIPSEHNNHYYLNQGGYSSVPSYVWSKNGPHPAALALRTRHALTAAVGRRFAEQLDFGPNGNALFLGVRYAGDSGDTVSLRNLGTGDTDVNFEVEGADALATIDAWGNRAKTVVSKGQATLSLGQLPLYVDLPKGARLTPVRLDWGVNLALAPQAAFSYSSTFKGELAWLNNGVIETYHAGNPNGDTNGKQIWQGDFPADPNGAAPTLEIAFKEPQRVDKLLLRGVRPDNAFCSILAYDLQCLDGGDWKTLAKVDRRRPASEEARTADATHATWMDDTNFYLNRFEPVTTTKLRLVFRSTSRGFVADDRARAWGNVIPQRVGLREVEIYGPSR